MPLLTGTCQLRRNAEQPNPAAPKVEQSNPNPEEPPPKRRVRTKKYYPDIEMYRTVKGKKTSFISGFSSISVLMLGGSFMFVPLYRMYCSQTGVGFDPKYYVKKVKEAEKQAEAPVDPENWKKARVEEVQRKRILEVRFLGEVGNTLPIMFVPLQKTIDILVGEPALAFYSAYNKTNRTLLGVSTYNIAPPEAMNYLNKIQCFCFEEQRFKPHELIEMPVFFYIDSDYLKDPLINWLDTLILNYTFFNLERTWEYIDRNW